MLDSQYYLSVNMWNQLDSDVQNTATKGEFKTRSQALDLYKLKTWNIKL